MILAWYFIWKLGGLDHWIDEDIDRVAKQGNYNRARRKKKRVLHGYTSEIPSIKIPERSDALLDRQGRRIMKL